ncbi:hypothetical protein BKA70DRAFT_1411100 [Coprinopsis sp. MPI-PUGE-AT-0042]|nr:hypothetical protein BKA70DRAFT_1411100 [Coprinopsis sp. MPI-PUGE-AT-0042]
MASQDDAMAGATTRLYKGKVTHRGWAQLPDDIIRWIATHYLYSLASATNRPQTWETRELWHQRMVYNVLRDGIQLEKNVMSICMGWHKALENHFFWRQAVSLIDPMDHFAANMYAQKPVPVANNRSSSAAAAAVSQPRFTPWRHLRNMLNCSCVICRINAPALSLGLGNVHHTKDRRSTMFTPCLGWINVCRDHERRKAAFCGLCLREAPVFESATATAALSQFGYHPTSQAHSQALTNMAMNVACMENEDEDTWPNVEATCRNCRLEWLWKKTSGSERDREAIVGPAALKTINALPRSSDDFPPGLQAMVFNSEDWETRQTIECFLDLGEGTITEVLCLAREKYWLGKHTKLGDMMMQAVAARKWSQNPGDLSGRASPERGQRSKGGYERQEQPIVELEEAATVTSTRTLSSTASDVSSEHDPRVINFEPEVRRQAVLREADDFESVADDEESLEDEDEDDEDASILQTEENGVKELALGDWARARILDGYWISPADSWYSLETGYPPPAPRWQRLLTEEQNIESKKGEGWTHAVHPCPWTIDKDSEESANARVAAEVSSSSAGASAEIRSEHQGEDKHMSEEPEESHPHWAIVVADIPPSYALCEQAFIAHGKMMRTILLPAMKNVVRKIVMECGAAASASEAYESYRGKTKRLEDPAIVASRMSLEDVVKILREEEAVWFDGVDWAQISKNKVEANDARVRREAATAASTTSASPPADEDDRGSYEGEMYRTATTASASSGSGSGSGPSPVLSTTTLATTPSPHISASKHLSEDKMVDEEGMVVEENPKILIPVSPILDQPKMLRPIPYVPMSIARFPQYTIEALKSVWREACAPLYQCRCSICERAAVAQAAAEARYEQARRAEYQQTQPAVTRSPEVPRVQQRQPTPPPPPREPRQQKFEHEGEILELEEVSLSELNDADFDSDEVVEIDFRGQPVSEGKKGADGLENAAYYFAKERERHAQPLSRARSGEDQNHVRSDDKGADVEKPVQWNTFDDDELRSFGLARDAKGNIFEITGDEEVDAATFQSRDIVVQSPLPSDEAGDTTSADGLDSGLTSRKRSCDHFDDAATVRLVNDAAASPKRARISSSAPASQPQTPRRRAVTRLRSPTTTLSPLLAPIEITPSANRDKVSPRTTQEESPMLRKRNSEEVDPSLPADPTRAKKPRMSLSTASEGGVVADLTAH